MRLTDFKSVKIGNNVLGYDPDGIIIIGRVISKVDGTLRIGESLEVSKEVDDGEVTTSIVICKTNRIHSDEFIYVLDVAELEKL